MPVPDTVRQIGNRTLLSTDSRSITDKAPSSSIAVLAAVLFAWYQHTPRRYLAAIEGYQRST
eukprot:3435600-Rhodomonas_salina.5